MHKVTLKSTWPNLETIVVGNYVFNVVDGLVEVHADLVKHFKQHGFIDYKPEAEEKQGFRLEDVADAFDAPAAKKSRSKK